MARRARPIRGIGRFRRLIRQLPDETRGEIVVELNVTGQQIQDAVIVRTPRRKGALQAGIRKKVLPASLRLQVGLLHRRQYGSDYLFYGRIQDLGRAQQVVNVIRRANKRRKLGKARGDQRKGRGALNRGQIRRTGDPYRMQVPAMAGKRFVTGRLPELRSTLRQNLIGIFSRGLRRAAGGAGEQG